MTQIGEHAVVLGAGLAGLADAAVLAQRFGRVTIVERDGLTQTGRARKGVPQGRHVHVLMPAGLRGLAELFPRILEDLREQGAHVLDAGALRFNIAGGSPCCLGTRTWSSSPRPGRCSRESHASGCGR